MTIKKVKLNELNKIVDQIIKESFNNEYDEFKKIVINSIDFSEYEGGDVRDSEKFRKGFESFMSEKSYEIKRQGEKRAFKDYVMGLPSWLNLPYDYYEIKNMLYSIGFDNVKDMDDEEDEVGNFYYDLLYNTFKENI